MSHNWRYQRRKVTHKAGSGIREDRCFKPSAPQSKADLMALHRDEMRERWRRQMGRVPTHRPRRINEGDRADRPEYRKSIWPKGKSARPGRMG